MGPSSLKIYMKLNLALCTFIACYTKSMLNRIHRAVMVVPSLPGPIQSGQASFIKELSKNNCVVCDNSITHNIDFPQAQMYKKKNKIIVAAQKASQ